VDGETFDTKVLKDRVVVVKFFAEHCIPCQRTLPAAEALHRDYPDVTFVGVSEDENERAIEQQVRKHGLTFPIVFDDGNVIAGRFRVSELPAAFVTDRQGRIAWVAGPGQTEDDLRLAVERFSQ
jgi:cytochrome c-type biogenesis protein